MFHIYDHFNILDRLTLQIKIKAITQLEKKTAYVTPTYITIVRVYVILFNDYCTIWTSACFKSSLILKLYCHARIFTLDFSKNN